MRGQYLQVLCAFDFGAFGVLQSVQLSLPHRVSLGHLRTLAGILLAYLPLPFRVRILLGQSLLRPLRTPRTRRMSLGHLRASLATQASLAQMRHSLVLILSW